MKLTEIPIMNKASKKRTLKIYVVSEKFENDTIDTHHGSTIQDLISRLKNNGQGKLILHKKIVIKGTAKRASK